MKSNFKYVILILVFILLVVSVTVNALFTKYSVQGLFEVNRKRFDLVFSNVMIDNDNISVKLDNEKKFIHIDIDDLEKEEEINIDIKNIGNIDGMIKNYAISNIDTNVDNDLIELTSSINNGDVVKKGESKKLTIKIKNKSNIENVHYNFNINYLFEEYNL